MRKAVGSLLSASLLLISGLMFLSSSLNGQENTKLFSYLPEDVDKIVSFSCVPCHTSNGGFLSREKLNFSEWTQYSPEKQKSKAEKMYSVLKKGSMPPKSARETRPEIIPNKDQTDAIRKWAESFKPADK